MRTSKEVIGSYPILDFKRLSSAAYELNIKEIVAMTLFALRLAIRFEIAHYVIGFDSYFDSARVHSWTSSRMRREVQASPDMWKKPYDSSRGRVSWKS